MAKKNSSKGMRQGAAGDRKRVQYNDQNVAIGTGGETHQIAGGETAVLTTQQGIPVSDDQNSLKIGARGPAAARS